MVCRDLHIMNLSGTIPQQLSHLKELQMLCGPCFVRSDDAMLLASSWRHALHAPHKKNRALASNPAVSGPIPEQLSALSLLTFLYIPPLLPKAAPKQALRGAQDISLLVHQH